MKYITVPQTPIEITDIHGNKIMRDENTVLTVSFLYFLLERLIDKKFTEDKSGGDAALFQYETKCAITDQKTVCETPGSIIQLENEQYKALLAATNEPDAVYNPALQHNLVGFITAIRSASSTK